MKVTDPACQLRLGAAKEININNIFFLKEDIVLKST